MGVYSFPYEECRAERSERFAQHRDKLCNGKVWYIVKDIVGVGSLADCECMLVVWAIDSHCVAAYRVLCIESSLVQYVID